MNIFNEKHNSLQGAKELDGEDKLYNLRNEFHYPLTESGDKALYFAGHSLGLMPKRAEEYIQEELNAWKAFGVEGHFKGKHPWLPYHEFLTEGMAKVVGGKQEEVVVMNSLTVNLHLMLVSFYRPTQKRFKILIENNTFPSDKYAVDSQAKFHGFDPREAIVQLQPSDSNGMTISDDDLVAQIKAQGDSLALVMLGNCNYLSGQCFNFEKVVQAAKEVGAMVGFNLAHGAGNLRLDLHNSEADFAVWCTYKYLNSGPGGLAGAFVHEKHLKDNSIPRFEGWWGTKKETRFKMKPEFEPMGTVESWQLSNPPIFQLASIRASLEIFNEAGMDNLISKRNQLTAYLEWLLTQNSNGKVEIVTPAFDEKVQKRGAMLCVRVKGEAKKVEEELKKKDAVVDFREPDILRMAPVPLYTSFEDVYELSSTISNALN